MVILGGWVLLMSEVPLYLVKCLFLDCATFSDARVYSAVGAFFFFFITHKPRVE